MSSSKHLSSTPHNQINKVSDGGRARQQLSERQWRSWQSLAVMVVVLGWAVAAGQDVEIISSGGGEGSNASSRYKITPTPLPEDRFMEQPDNATVHEGEVAVMKCKMKMAVQKCRWFYLEFGKNFYDENESPKKVKEFNPAKDIDCSIKFTSVKKIQEGQWLCQARKFARADIFNSRPANLRVITAAEEREYEESLARDPPAPTAIPAMQPPIAPGAPTPTTRQRMPQFSYKIDDQIQNTRTGEEAVLRCQVDQPVTACSWIMPNNALFVWNDADSAVGRSLNINTPIAPMGGGGEDGNIVSYSSSVGDEEYKFIGNRDHGNCSLKIERVRHHDEGNWRCVVKVRNPNSRPVHRVLAASQPPAELEVEGPFIHLHLLEYHSHAHGPPSGPSNKHESSGTNMTLIILFLVGLVVFLIGAVIIYCCYKRVWSKQEENNAAKLQTPSRANDSEYSQQWFQGRNLKIVDPNYSEDFKLRSTAAPGDVNLRNIDALNMKNLDFQHAGVKYSDLDHYNQYISMNHSMAGHGSVRSSASSNTTLSTVLPDPMGRDRSISFGGGANSSTASSAMSPINMHMTPAMSQHCHRGSLPDHHHHHHHIHQQQQQQQQQQVPFYEIHRGGLQRPVSLYSTGHVYEEIQDKVPIVQLPPHHVINSQGMIVPASAAGTPTTPVYTNVVEDNDGYLIPNKSAKIVNTPTEEGHPICQYLPMRGDGADVSGHSANDISYHRHIAQPIPNLNNLSQNHGVMRNIQSVPHDVASERRQSGGSIRSEEDNRRVAVESVPSGGPFTSTPLHNSHPQHHPSQQPPNPHENSVPSNNTNAPITSQVTTVSSTAAKITPTSKQRQKLPIPNSGGNQPALQLNQTSKAPPPPQQVQSPSALAAHQRTTSLPDTSNAAPTTPGSTPTKVSHVKSPSLVPTPENYDVPKSGATPVLPRTLDAVPRSVNGSEISLDDIDGTIV